MSESVTDRLSLKYWWFLLPVAFLFLWKLGDQHLYAWDEIWYAEVAKAVVEGHGWHLYWKGEPFYDKPPLMFWLMALLIKLGGDSATIIRLPSVLFGIGAIILTTLIGKWLFPNLRAAMLAALILAMTLPFLKSTRMAMLDVPLTFGLLLGIYGWLVAHPYPRRAIWVGLGFGCAFFIKGMAALLLPAILIPFALWQKERQIWCNPWLYVGFIFPLLVILPWYATQSPDFGSAHFGKHVWQRIWEPLDGHTGSPFFYLKYLATHYLPWGIFIPFTGIFLYQHRHYASMRLLICWVLVPLLLFSMVYTKISWYIVPVYPALALAIGWYLDDILTRSWFHPALTCALLLLGGLFSLFALRLLTTDLAAYAAAPFCLALGCLMAGQLYQRKQSSWRWVFFGCTFISALILIFLGLNWR